MIILNQQIWRKDLGNSIWRKDLGYSEPEDLEKRFGELKALLMEREYRERSIVDAIKRVLKISEREALKKVETSWG